MTDSEILKALECCGNTIKIGCPECPLYYPDDDGECITELCKQGFSLVTRQQAEVERLTETLNATIAGQESLQNYIPKDKSEARREFAERLKKKKRVWEDNGYWIEYISLNEIDNILKEMEEEK